MLVEPAADADFWDAFIPGLASGLLATVVGVAIGVPIALWLDSKRTAHAHRGETLARQNAFARIVEALRASITWNGEKAASLKREIEDGAIPFDVSLETARWEAVRSEFVRLADDPELQWRVAFFFGNVRRCAEMQDRRFEFAVGVSASTELAGEVTKALTAQLLDDLPAIETEARELDRLLRELLAADTDAAASQA